MRSVPRWNEMENQWLICLTDSPTAKWTGVQAIRSYFLAIMILLRHWDIYLRGGKFTFPTDHEPIRYLQTKAGLSGRQSRWWDVPQSYTYETQHVPGPRIQYLMHWAADPIKVLTFENSKWWNMIGSAESKLDTPTTFCIAHFSAHRVKTAVTFFVWSHILFKLGKW